MPAVFVHGVPETPSLWDPLRSHLHRDDVIAVQLPGFGCPRPSGFGATKEEYVAWLVGELEQLQGQGPIDLVGHDWGGGLTLRLVSIRSDLVRSYVTDAAGLGDLRFEWHEFAKIWQTPEAGEEFFAAQMALSPEAQAGVFEGFGVPHDEAMKMGAALDQTMADCILALYRSAMNVGNEWAPEFKDIPKPGMVVVPSNDPFLADELARSSATNAGARVVEFADVSHWWMMQEPAKGAAMLEEFWASLG